MTGKALMAVSTPCNIKGKASGHRVLQYSNHKLSILSGEANSDKIKSNIDTNIQAFCYLTPKDGMISPSLGDKIMDTSDYMVLAKSNGFIEIIKDYQYKIENKLSLNPSFVLKCSPEDFNSIGSDFMFAGVQYKDGILYCCMCSGTIYLFLLNLPSSYVQKDNSFITPLESDETYDLYSDIVNELGREPQSVEESTLFSKMQFTGRSKVKHICYYLLPMEPEHLRTCPSLFLLDNAYKNNIIYKPSMYVSLMEDIFDFRIDPLDRLSFFTISPGQPLVIRKMMLPMTYVNFFVKFVNIKKRIVDSNGEEIKSWDQIAIDMDYSSFLSYVIDDPQDNIDIDPTAFNQISTMDNISLLRTFIVWIQRSDHSADDISRLFNQNESLTPRGHRGLTRSPSLRRVSRYTLQRRGLREPVDLPTSNNWGVAPLIRDVRRNTFTVDFKVVHIRQTNNHIANQNASHEFESTRTLFLTDNYKNMDIVCIDRYLSLSIFRPSSFDIAVTKVDNFHDYQTPENEYHDYIINEDTEFKRALNGLTSFKKVFTITESLLIILDTNGVLMVDREHLIDPKNLTKNPANAIRIAPFNIGLISDATMIVHKLEKSKQNGGYDVSFDLIVTCIPGEILALEGEFPSTSKMATLKLCDSLTLKRKNKFVDKLCLISYEPLSLENKKRHCEYVYPSITKRKKWDLKAG